MGLSDLNLEAAKSVASRFGIQTAYADAGEMIAAERPDLVDICTPPATHAKVGRMAAASGCNVLIEKPMALTVADCDTIVSTARNVGVQVCVAHTGLFYEPFVRARTMVENGAIGRFAGMRVIISTPSDYMTSTAITGRTNFLAARSEKRALMRCNVAGVYQACAQCER